MRYDLTTPITDLLGKPMMSDNKPGPTPGSTVEDEDSPPLTLGVVLFRAALFVQAGMNPPAEEKFRQGKLAEKIIKAGSTVDLTTEEMAKLRTQVGIMYFPTIVMRVWELLDAHVHPAGGDKIQ
jgi:hypothetical protein